MEKSSHIITPVSGIAIKILIMASLTVMVLATSAGATPITGCTTINTSGHYTLQNDIINTDVSGACISITASNVIFDGAGYTIDGVDSGSTYGVYAYNPGVNLTSVTVKNLVVTDWDYGIYYKNVQNGSITNNTVSSSIIRGIQLESSSSNNLTGNTVTSTTRYDGIILWSSSYNTLTNNTVSSNSRYGIFLYISSNYNTLSNNTVSSNARGINLESSGSNTIYNNYFNNTVNAYFTTAGSNSWNTILANGTNIIGGPYLGGNYWAKPDGSGFSETCQDMDADGICDSAYTLASGNVDYLPLSAPALRNSVTSCGRITSPGVYTLLKDITNSGAATCIRIISSNVTFDGQGYTIDGVDTSGTSGVYVYNSTKSLTNVTVENLVVTDWDYGIYYKDVQNGSIENNTVSSSIIRGIQLESSNYTNVISNTVTSTSLYDGIILWSSSYNTLTNNTVSSNSRHGIWLYISSNYNTLSNNTVSSNARGINLESSGRNTIYNNYFNNTNNFGFGGTIYSNDWNTTLANGTNIIGGPYLGGNYWAKPDGTGFSQTCQDVNRDGLCDSNYTLGSGNLDYLPLVILDMTAPEVTINYPVNTTYQQNVTLINASVSDNTIIDTVLAEVDGSYNVTLSLSGGYYINNTVNIGDGNHRVRIFANDSSGNLNATEVVYFTIDHFKINTCSVINSPGVYVLNTNIINSNVTGACINITASNVTLDGQGRTIDGIDSGFKTYGVYVYNSGTTLTNVTVKNLVLTDWSTYGGYTIYYNNTENGSVINNTITSGGTAVYLGYSNYMNITGNMITSNVGGVMLSASSFNNIRDNIITYSNNRGVSVDLGSNSNNIINNTISNHDSGVRFFFNGGGSGNIVANNTITSNRWYGLMLQAGSSNSFVNNIIASNACGIYLSISGNLIYNNLFNNTKNHEFSHGANSWNTTKTAGMNIVGGPYLGGNYWAKPDGTGFSQTCADGDGDGICDSAFTIASNNIDYLPLTLNQSRPPTADCGADRLSCENVGSPVQFDGSASFDPDGTIVSYDWDFGDGQVGSGVAPKHVYTSYNWNGTAYAPFTVTLTVTDDRGATDTDTQLVVVWIAGDANGDGVVNIIDGAILGLNWGGADACADLNNDGVVNIIDAATVGLNWGRTA